MWFPLPSTDVVVVPSWTNPNSGGQIKPEGKKPKESHQPSVVFFLPNVSLNL